MTYFGMCFGLLLFLFGKRDKLDAEMFWQPWLLFLCRSLVLFGILACEEGLVRSGVHALPLSLSLCINWAHKRCHLPARLAFPVSLGSCRYSSNSGDLLDVQVL